MTGLWARTWFRVTVGVGLAVLAAVVGGVAGFIGDPKLTFFLEAQLNGYPLQFLLLTWTFVLLIAGCFRPAERRARPLFAAVAVMLLAGLSQELDIITPWGLLQALMCAGVITWAGFGRMTPKSDKGGGA